MGAFCTKYCGSASICDECNQTIIQKGIVYKFIERIVNLKTGMTSVQFTTPGDDQKIYNLCHACFEIKNKIK